MTISWLYFAECIEAVDSAKISIVTPWYNQGQFIERTVRSVFGQQYANLEYILMDGGSTDAMLSVLEPYRDKFAYFRSGADKGQADAIASGFEVSTGEIMAYLNSDDILAPGTLHFINEFFREHPKVDFIYSDRVLIDEDDTVLGYWILPRHFDFLMRRWDLIPQETCFWRRPLLEKAGNIDPSLHFTIDYDLFVRFMKFSRFLCVNRILAAFRVHSLSKTSNQMTTVGKAEVDAAWRKYRIRHGAGDAVIEEWLTQLVGKYGELHARSNRCLSGAFPGIGYDYDSVWGGFLKSQPKCQ